jgi:hypothetical protein
MGNDLLVKKRRDQPLQVKGKLRLALLAMVHEGMSIAEAAQHVGMTGYAIRLAFEKPHVIAFVRMQKQVMRSSVCAANISVLAGIRDESENDMARVRAVSMLEDMDGAERQHGGNAGQSPGLVIQIVTNGPEAPAKPLIDITPDLLSE